MSDVNLVLVLLGLVIVIAIGVALWLGQRMMLRRRFGPEYDRLLARHKTPGLADRELRDRIRRHSRLRLRPLNQEQREWYVDQWQHIQSRFVQAPDEAVNAADELVTRLLKDRGYPSGQIEEQVAMISVDHPRTVHEYRQARDNAVRHSRGESDTEERRQAMVHYRAFVGELLGTDPTPAAHIDERSSHARRVDQ